MRQFRLFVLPIVLLLALAPQAIAQEQEPQEFREGLRPYDTLRGGNIDSISMSTGEVTFHIPIWSFPQRGQLKLDLFLFGKTWKYRAKEPTCPGGEETAC
jgi:hypothetical protein